MRKHITFYSSGIYDSYTDYLFSRPSFLEGVSRALDLGSTLNNYNVSDSAQEADYKAIFSDWLTLGNDLRRSIFTILNEQKSSSKDDPR